MNNYMTKYGPLDSLAVTYFSYGLANCGGSCGPFPTRKAAEESRAEGGGDKIHGEIFESSAEGLEALEILEKLEEYKKDRVMEELTKVWRQG